MKTYLLYPNGDQEKMIADFLEANNISFFEDDDAGEQLPQHVIDGIKRGQEDGKAGRTITLEEFRKKHLSNR
ncbi:hypothetical protein [Mucilaginibacter flavidus]|uniref:hypothetical protein n=1 Tax=Mucilaginibacter flavidus TaxID=2949309 RepID=UPI0020926C78|nr:hypothetical protein [Mucilaginibacter flavidus]MCO5945973.1 hypothetical protein [Mucilaginibacter flavidus]